METISTAFLIGLLSAIVAPAYESYESAKANNRPVQSAAHENVLDDNYSLTENNHCKVHNPAPRHDETVTWSGECVEGYAHGRGVVKWYQHGEVFATDTGLMKHGKLNGYVVTQFIDGDTFQEGYEGQMVNGIREGHGVYLYNDGSYYIGQYKHNKQNGYGKMSFSPNRTAAIDLWQNLNIGHFEGNQYIVEGIFNNNNLEIECAKNECPSQ